MVSALDVFTVFPHYGIFLLHKLNSCRGNYSRVETIRGNTVCKMEARIRKNVTKRNTPPESILTKGQII